MIDHDNLHRKRINRYIRQIEEAYNQLIKSVSELAVKSYLRDELYRFRKQPHIIKGVDAALVAYMEAVASIIGTGSLEEWKFAEAKITAINLAAIENIKDRVSSKAYLKKVSEVSRYKHNEKAFNTWQNRKRGDFTISKRVWSIGNKAKENLEIAIDASLKEGMSAQELARSIKRNLNNPDALFRKVRDKHGTLRLSQAAQAYKPGRGVYRSAHKNALRLAANEINTAYREAEQERIRTNNDVVAVEISLSPQHSVVDMCDDLKGRYPKNFQWAGWHVACKCRRTLIMKSEEEFITELNNGENKEPSSSTNYIDKPPKQMYRWIEENEDRMQNWKRKPEFMLKNNIA